MTLPELPPGDCTSRYEISLSFDEGVRPLEARDAIISLPLLSLLHSLELESRLPFLQVHLELHIVKILHHFVKEWVIRFLRQQRGGVRTWGCWSGAIKEEVVHALELRLLTLFWIRSLGDYDRISRIVLFKRTILLLAGRAYEWFLPLATINTSLLTQTFGPYWGRRRHHDAQVYLIMPLWATFRWRNIVRLRFDFRIIDSFWLDRGQAARLSQLRHSRIEWLSILMILLFWHTAVFSVFQLHLGLSVAKFGSVNLLIGDLF